MASHELEPALQQHVHIKTAHPACMLCCRVSFGVYLDCHLSSCCRLAGWVIGLLWLLPCAQVAYGVCAILAADKGEAYGVMWTPSSLPGALQLPVSPDHVPTATGTRWVTAYAVTSVAPQHEQQCVCAVLCNISSATVSMTRCACAWGPWEYALHVCLFGGCFHSQALVAAGAIW